MVFERALGGRGATVSLAALLASATPALAQAAAPAGEAVQEARPSAAAAGGIEAIIVTARIRRETAMQTPASVTALSGAPLERPGLGTMQAPSATVPNVQIYTYFLTEAIFPRGI